MPHAVYANHPLSFSAPAHNPPIGSIFDQVTCARVQSATLAIVLLHRIRTLLAHFRAPESAAPSGYRVRTCLEALLELCARPDAGTPLANAMRRAAGINDQEDDDNVMWRALGLLGVERGPQLRVLSLPKDAGRTPALKAEMWQGLGPVHLYDADARADAGDASARREASLASFLAELQSFTTAEPYLTLVVTSPLGNHGLLQRVATQVRTWGKRLLLVFYSGQYNLRGAHTDIGDVLDLARILDISRHPLFCGRSGPTDSMWRVVESCPDFEAFCEFANPQLAASRRRFRAHFNRQLIAPRSVFDRHSRPPRQLLDQARSLWRAAEDASDPDADQLRLDAYRSFLQRPDSFRHVTSWKRSTVVGFERDAPIADACVALVYLLLRKAPEELRIVRGRWSVEGGHSVVRPREEPGLSEGAGFDDLGPGNYQMSMVLREPRRWVYQCFIGLLAAACAYPGAGPWD